MKLLQAGGSLCRKLCSLWFPEYFFGVSVGKKYSLLIYSCILCHVKYSGLGCCAMNWLEKRF